MAPKGKPKYHQPVDPTPEEIRQACLEIRATWSAAETRRRSAWLQPERWGLQSVEAEELGLDPGYRD